MKGCIAGFVLGSLLFGGQDGGSERPGKAVELEPERGRLVDRNWGYSLDVPSFGVSSESTAQAVILSAAPDSGFAANLNVLNQPFAEGFEAYLELTLDGIEKLGLELESKKDRQVGGHPACELVYEGEVGGNDLRFRALAVADGDRVLVVTCTAHASSFERYDSEFRTALDSFRVLD